MPLYEYRCPKCGTFERMQKFSDPVLATCPTCERPVEKLLSAPAIQFKGSGWYVTDYAGKSSARETDGKDSSAKAGTDKGSPAKASGSSSDGAAGKAKASSGKAGTDSK